MLFEASLPRTIENKAFDLMTLIRQRESRSQVVLIAIDSDSINRLGSWPWSRDKIAEMIDLLSKAGAKTIGLDLPFPEPEMNAGIQEIKRLQENLTKKSLKLNKYSLGEINKNLADSEKRLDNDLRLRNAIKKSGVVILPLQFNFGNSSWADQKIPDWLNKYSLEYVKETLPARKPVLQLTNPLPTIQPEIIEATSIMPPYLQLAENATTLGHNNFIPTRDGIVRKANLFITLHGRVFPSLALQMALINSKDKLSKIKGFYSNESITTIKTAAFEIPIDCNYQMLLDFNPDPKNYSIYPFHAVLNGKVKADLFKGKSVLIGLTSPGLVPRYETPINQDLTGIELTAITLENILTDNHINRPEWARMLEMAVLLFFALFIILIIPRVKISLGSTILFIFIITWQAAAIFLFTSSGIWLKAVSPTLLALLGLLLIIINRKLFNPLHTDADLESNKMLGLTFQSQGMLDLAFEKFMKCPIKDPAVKDLLYNLGLDFERKRMHNKAVAVYEHIIRDGKFKDTAEKIKQLQANANLPSLARTSGDATIMTSGTIKPTLGRYEIIRELGQGAIGTVYLGRDPKINRSVAIKTLRYEEVDPEDLAEVRERFFREAEAAGKLNHPNIVTIYDIDEDLDMTYMAMELLSGSDLTPYCRFGNLLPVPKVLQIITEVADALDYAHKNNVVHRDIKPANIVMLEDGHIKVADFGIARLLTSSKTQTGVVLGTPNYMSPEQVAGLRVDGRSDLFSLGIVFYELLSGKKPFQNDNIATLMHTIATASYTPLPEIDPGIEPCCIDIVHKLMSKAKSRRFASARELAEATRKCLRELNR
ncbi:MAG: CHASE2 domain-containing protein [Proteobacteria bacterium]|nr:CHASE2 domain-containing protein [Pseudomonadota bacterium]MBU1716106.1 CHASE2 domain-containing protein [Pseudomonadota bacterium]